MRTGAAVLIGWGCGLLAVLLLGLLAFDLGALPGTLLACAGAGSVLGGVAAGVAGRRDFERPADERPRVLVDSSVSTFALAAGSTTALVGAAVAGKAIFWPGVGIMLVGMGGLVRERLAERRLRRSLPR